MVAAVSVYSYGGYVATDCYTHMLKRNKDETKEGKVGSDKLWLLYKYKDSCSGFLNQGVLVGPQGQGGLDSLGVGVDLGEELQAGRRRVHQEPVRLEPAGDTCN